MNYQVVIISEDGKVNDEYVIREAQYQDISEIAVINPLKYTRHALALDIVDTIEDELKSTHKTLDEILAKIRKGLS